MQIRLLDVLIDAGARVVGNTSKALVNGNFAAAEHLTRRGDPLNLASALLFAKWVEADELAKAADPEEKQFSLTLSALNGRPGAVERLIGYGVDINRPARNLYSHATPLHHAVRLTGTVQVLLRFGARMDIKDTAFGGTPLGLGGLRRESGGG